MDVSGTPRPRLKTGANGYAKRRAKLNISRQITTTIIFRISCSRDSPRPFRAGWRGIFGIPDSIK
jgi:hypothetical protein